MATDNKYIIRETPREREISKIAEKLLNSGFNMNEALYRATRLYDRKHGIRRK
jgi:hypothetical protein